MITFCVTFAVACGLTLVYLDDTFYYVRPWIAAVGMCVGLWGAIMGAVL
jgi:hypothetical protein